MSARYVCDAERCSIIERFAELGGTLDGRPARVYGRALDFPIVAVTRDGGASAEYSWATLRRIVDAGHVHLRSGGAN